jgi:hypothetical protein
MDEKDTTVTDLVLKASIASKESSLPILEKNEVLNNNNMNSPGRLAKSTTVAVTTASTPHHTDDDAASITTPISVPNENHPTMADAVVVTTTTQPSPIPVSPKGVATVVVEEPPPPQQQQEQRSHSSSSSWWWLVLLLLLHLSTILVYVYPLYVSHYRRHYTNGRDTTSTSPEAVLDELHIVSEDNYDINGRTTLYTIFTNDYWGRPLTYPASHKSWRPLTVLSFRYLRGIDIRHIFHISDLTMHRFINIITHATTADLVGKLAVQLLLPLFVTPASYRDNNHNNENSIQPQKIMRGWIFVITKVCFALHPTHVEVVINAANRSHMVAVLLAVYACDPSIPVLCFILATIMALLSSETALFQIIPIAITMVAISYLQMYHPSHYTRRHHIPRPHGNMIYQLFHHIVYQTPNVLFRIVWLGIAAVTYYGGRLYYNTLSIPEGLIRPAENPFFPLRGWERFYSYLMVVGIHIAKQYDGDYIGFSHEYGYNCIPTIDTWYHHRLLPVYMIGFIHVVMGGILMLRQRRRRTISKGLILYVVTLAWTFTLFPISGIVKVGTFISDRIVVASTVPIAILQAYGIISWLQLSLRHHHNNSSTGGTSSTSHKFSWIDAMLNPHIQRKLFLLGIIFLFAWRRIHVRSMEWMSSDTLLESSLRTCPQFAKGHLEISKIYSGLYPHKFNLTQARYHLNEAERIDPNYCDVHFQFALLEAREHHYIPFEERLVNALQCGFTMGQAHPIWHQYWPSVLDETHNHPSIVAQNRKRYESYMSILAKAIEKEESQEQKTLQERNKSPLVFK